MPRLSKWTEEQKRLYRKNLVKFRSDLNWTQGDVATRAGVTVFSVSRYEGGGMPDNAEMLSIAKAFGRQVEDFFTENPPARRPPAVAVRTKIIGDEPPGLADAIEAAVKKYTTDYALERSRIKEAMKRGKKR